MINKYILTLIQKYNFFNLVKYHEFKFYLVTLDLSSYNP